MCHVLWVWNKNTNNKNNDKNDDNNNNNDNNNNDNNNDNNNNNKNDIEVIIGNVKKIMTTPVGTEHIG